MAWPLGGPDGAVAGGSQVLSHAVAGAAQPSGRTWMASASTPSTRRAALGGRKATGRSRSTSRRSTSSGAAFGLASPPRRTTASAPRTSTPPPPRRRRRCAVCGRTFRVPREWLWNSSAVVHLGCSILCTVRFFATDPTDKHWRNRGPVAVITAVLFDFIS